jgi:hypothetical protein
MMGLGCITLVPSLPYRLTLPSVVLLAAALLAWRKPNRDVFNVVVAYAAFWTISCVVTARSSPYYHVAVWFLLAGQLLLLPAAVHGLRACRMRCGRLDLGVASAAAFLGLLLASVGSGLGTLEADTRMDVALLLIAGLLVWLSTLALRTQIAESRTRWLILGLLGVAAARSLVCLFSGGGVRETVRLRPYGRPFAAEHAEPGVPNPASPGILQTRPTFGGRLCLLKCRPVLSTVWPGGKLSLFFEWESIAPVDPGWRVFVHCRKRVYGGMFFQGDHRFQDVGQPPGDWAVGAKCAYTLDIAVPDNSSPGEYSILVGVWDGTDRLSLSGIATGEWSVIAGQQVEIGRITMRPRE